MAAAAVCLLLGGRSACEERGRSRQDSCASGEAACGPSWRRGWAPLCRGAWLWDCLKERDRGSGGSGVQPILFISFLSQSATKRGKPIEDGGRLQAQTEVTQRPLILVIILCVLLLFILLLLFRCLFLLLFLLLLLPFLLRCRKNAGRRDADAFGVRGRAEGLPGGGRALPVEARGAARGRGVRRGLHSRRPHGSWEDDPSHRLPARVLCRAPRERWRRGRPGRRWGEEAGVPGFAAVFFAGAAARAGGLPRHHGP